jgi:hypothetical protein
MLQTAASDNVKYFKRRQSIRNTWLPALAALPTAAHAFVVSRPTDESILKKIQREEKFRGGPFMVLDTEACIWHLFPDVLLFLVSLSFSPRKCVCVFGF